MNRLIINGKETNFDEGKMPATIAELLTALGVESTTVIAELDGRIVERGKFADTALRDGQAIELIRFVPGG